MTADFHPLKRYVEDVAKVHIFFEIAISQA